MKTVSFTIKGTTAVSFSRMHDTPKLEKESPDLYETRTWREKCHVNASGLVEIPGVAVRDAVINAAQKDSRKIPGKGHGTYTKHFTAGLMITDSPILCDAQGNPYTKDTLIPWTGFMNADGKRGSGTRVKRTFPEAPAGWTASATMIILDAVITEKLFEEYAMMAGLLVGIGRWRPENRGMYGRFKIEKIKWS